MIRLTEPAHVHRALANIRNDAGKTQRGLAAEVGFRGGQINDWENGHARPNLDSLVRLAAACGYDLALVRRAGALTPDRRTA